MSNTLKVVAKTFVGSLSALVMISALNAASAADYVIDSKGAHASVNFKISHMGFSWLLGGFNSFSGTFSYDDDNPAASKVSVTIDTKSIDSNHAERDKHLRSKDFLEVDKYPEASFVSKSYTPGAAGTAVLKGDLTLHGVTREVAIDVEKIGAGNDPWGGYRMGFSGTTQLKLTDYGINYNLGPASEMVYLTLNIEGVKQ